MMREKRDQLPDVASARDVGMGIARLTVEGLMVKAQMGAAAAAQGVVEPWPGARCPVGPARPRVELVELVDVLGDDRKERLTPIGYRTARERLPQALLAASPAQLAAALRYRHVVEAVASVGWPGGIMPAPRSGKASDGGAVHRTALAQELRYSVACLGGIALERGNLRGDRRDISVRALVDGVVLGGAEIKAVLRAHGWSGKGQFVKLLTERLHEALVGMSEVQSLGYDR